MATGTFQRRICRFTHLFLFGRAEGHKENVGGGCIDPRKNSVVVHLQDVGLRRRVTAATRRPGYRSASFAVAFSATPRAPPRPKMENPARAGQLGEQRDQVASGHALFQRMAEEPGEPDDGNAVGHDQVGFPAGCAEAPGPGHACMRKSILAVAIYAGRLE